MKYLHGALRGWKTTGIVSYSVSLITLSRLYLLEVLTLIKVRLLFSDGGFPLNCIDVEAVTSLEAGHSANGACRLDRLDSTCSLRRTERLLCVKVCGEIDDTSTCSLRF